jgi:ELWxxDGT repeat protein
MLAADAVEDIYPGATGSTPADLVNVHGTLFFTADHPTFGRELWRSGGRASNTDIVRDIRRGESASDPHNLTAVGRTLFFTANARGTGTELWKSDGTAAGTVLVKDINPGRADSDPQSLTNVNGTLYFSAFDPDHGREVWASDGTAGGTRLVRDVAPGVDSYGPKSSDPDGFAFVNGWVLFRARSDRSDVLGHPVQLWRTDGTELGTVMLWKDDLAPAPFTVADGRLFFYDTDTVKGDAGLWVTDGTYRHTHIVYWRLGRSTEVGMAGGHVVFTSDDAVWRTDGTTDGTELVKANAPWHARWLPSGLTDYAGNGYFVVYAGRYYDCALWRTDGTTRGTAQVRALYVGEQATPDRFAVAGGKLFIATNDGVYQSDGTTMGTVLVKRLGYDCSITSLTAVGDALFMAATSPRLGRELWVLPLSARAGASASVAAPSASAVSAAAFGMARPPERLTSPVLELEGGRLDEDVLVRAGGATARSARR